MYTTSDGFLFPHVDKKKKVFSDVLYHTDVVSDGDTGINRSPFSPSPRHLSDSSIIERGSLPVSVTCQLGSACL